MAVFFTADSHFSLADYQGTVARDYRPFKNVQKMNNFIVKAWNKQARKGDLIYHLGDFVNFNAKDKQNYLKCFNFVKKIKADVILILGNNEERILETEFNGDFDKFKQFLIGLGFKNVILGGCDLKLGNNDLYLTHYPSKHKEGVINLFGHIHGCCFVKKYGFNVGVDNHYLRLFSQPEIEKLIDNRKYYDSNVYD